MRIMIQKIVPTVEAELDATPFLDETEHQLITQELEFNAFERTMPDVMLSLSDLSDTFTDLFSGMRKPHLYSVNIYGDDGRRRFWGYVDNESVRFFLRDRYAKFTAYSGLKRFWQKAKTCKLFIPSTGTFTTTITLDELFRYEIDQTDIREGGTTFLGFDLGTFGTSTIRGYGTGYKGTFENLNRSTTWEELLKALSLWHNAEFYIDPESRTLKMVHRVSVLNNRLVDIDARLCDDEEIEVLALESKSVDYIQSYALTYSATAPTEAAKPVPLPYPFGDPRIPYGLQPGTHYYRVLHETSDGSPSIASDVLAVLLGALPDGIAGWKTYIRIPINPGGIGRRLLFRSDPTDITGGWFLCGIVEANTLTETVIEDLMHFDYLHTQIPWPDVEKEMPVAWYSFDELTDAWTQTIDIPRGRNTPQGNIFSCIPKLRFLNPYNRSVELEDNPRNTFDFFLQDFNIAEAPTRTRWADLLRTRRVVSCKVTGVDWEVGDSVVSAKNLFPNDLTSDKRMVVRRAVCHLIDDTSQLELVTV